MDYKGNIGVGIGVMLYRDGKILLGKRHDDPLKAKSLLNGAGTWTMPGGKIRFKETFKEAVYRETLEETGIMINNIKLISVTNDINENFHFVTMGFLCDDFSREASVMEPDEITEWKWFGLNLLPSPIFLPSEKVIKNYLNNSIYTN